MVLRPYQNAAVEAIRNQWKLDYKNTISSSYRTGKTVVFSKVVEEEIKMVMF